MKFLLFATLSILLGLVSFSTNPSSSPMATPEKAVVAVETKPDLPAPNVGEDFSALMLAYDPYDDCVGKWQNIWPRKTPGGREPEKMGIGADPTRLPYGTKLKFHEDAICKFIRDTDPTNQDCVLPVDDTGSAAKKDTARGIYHLELRVPRRTPDEDAHQRALLFGRHENTEVEVIYSPSHQI